MQNLHGDTPEWHWNHRIVRYTEKDETIYEIAECHFEDGRFAGWTPGSAYISTQSEHQAKEYLRLYLEWMLKALDEPIIETTG